MNEKDVNHVFLIILDTFREDFASTLAEELSKFEFRYYNNVISPAPWTVPTHASLITGLYLASHKVHETKNKKLFKLNSNIKLNYNVKSFNMVTHFKFLKYRTYLLSANPLISPFFGYTMFDNYINLWIPFVIRDDTDFILGVVGDVNGKLQKFMKEYLLNPKKLKVLVDHFKVNPYFLFKSLWGYSIKYLKWPKDKGITNATKYLEEILTNSKDKKFIMINLMEAHEPYYERITPFKEIENNRKGYSPPPKFIHQWKREYPRQVNYLRLKIKSLFKIIIDLGMFENSLIIVTSDHGQLLGEYGLIGHGIYLTDELLNVPLFIKYPANKKLISYEESIKEYISLTEIKNIIFSILKNDVFMEKSIYSPMVFAESYGIPNLIVPQNDREKNHIEKLEKYKIAIYYQGEKYIFNVNDWKFESNKNSDVKRGVLGFLNKNLKR